ncbi:MAG: holdfast anchoring protein HfaA [Brevundimonas sp.]|jgi:holdfast attachment protein HfaA|uniref:holdfast anchoring protein HfaA n=1 Tax=Brevundimonas sp. TaxID=1871086 RepID=UPI00275B4ECE|nr:holdfast anchoring protein HfaA [Brevundimonas sp.]MDP3401728.1 holdfast anchoring protein HfaA [Brevundimonas sp.]MDZ4110363.1 holdfast anchoring protein HfaA [Brevundimonas sp.]
MKILFVALILSAALPAGAAMAQTSPSGNAGSLEAGYGGAGRVASQPFNPTTRDANGNRLVVNGVIVNGQDGSTVTYSQSSAGGPSGADWLQSGAGSARGDAGATAIGNLLTVSITGSGNTVVLNSRQTNNATVNATVRRP